MQTDSCCLFKQQKLDSVAVLRLLVNHPSLYDRCQNVPRCENFLLPLQHRSGKENNKIVTQSTSKTQFGIRIPTGGSSAFETCFVNSKFFALLSGLEKFWCIVQNWDFVSYFYRPRSSVGFFISQGKVWDFVTVKTDICWFISLTTMLYS